MSRFEIMTLIGVFAPFLAFRIKSVIEFINKMNRSDQTRKDLARVRRRVDKHHIRIAQLEHRRK